MLNVQKSYPPLTEFSPHWEIPFYIKKYDNHENIDKIKSWIIQNEKRIIEKYKTLSRGDGGTGLSEQSLTAQYNSFNLFLETEGLPEFEDLLNFIKTSYRSFMEEYHSEIRECYLWCWANVLRKGEKIALHNHSSTEYSYISGNIHLDDYSTETKYFHPIERYTYNFPNVKGKLTMFPSYLYHETDEHLDDQPRVSIAFDLLDIRHSENHEKNRIKI